MTINNKNINFKILENYETVLREALVNGEFLLHFQPYLELKTRKIAGVESLIRWQHPVYGLIAPDLFIPFAERAGLIDLIGEWVLKQACSQINQWHALGIEVPTMSVNVSPRQFDGGSMPELVKSVLKKNNLAPRQLDLEITESSAPSDETTMQASVAAIRQLGVKISIDDFGKGYSSLERLRTTQVDRLKIDRAFVSNLASNAKDSCLVQSVIHLAHQLGVTVTAEGVETLETSKRLREMGCDQGQGFYFSRALDATDCEKYLQDMQQLQGSVA